MDGELSADASPAGGMPAGSPKSPARPVKPLPSWVSALPDRLDVSDDLEVVARLTFQSLVTALVRVHADRFMPVAQRVALISQLNAQLIAAVSKRRIWLAEQVIKGNERVIAETSRGPEMEMAPDAAGTNSVSEARRPTARRGRPRKR